MIGAPIDIDDRFREKDLADPSFAIGDRWQAFQRGFEEPEFSFPGGESNRDVGFRGISAMNQVLDKYSGKRVAIGIHGCIMTIIMAHYDPRFDVHFLRNLPRPAIYKLAFKRGEYTDSEKVGTFGS